MFLRIIATVMDRGPASAIAWLFDRQQGAPDRLIPRWLFLRALGAIYFSAFFSLVFQIRGLIGPDGILPASRYLHAVEQSLGHWQRVWYAPTLVWFSAGARMVRGVCWAGMLASLLLVLNLWPRGMLVISFVCFLSFVSAAQDFSGYQSDGMLLEAGFIAFFFAPPGFRPGLGQLYPASRASLFMLQWEWFRIYFESGVVKLLSGDPEWRHFTAMDEYYQNEPLPTWVGWYVQHLPHGFHAGTVYATLALELGLVCMLFLPRRWRTVCFFIVTPWQVGVILTANYTFLNYLVLAMGVLMLDDRFVLGAMPEKWRVRLTAAISPPETPLTTELTTCKEKSGRYWRLLKLSSSAVMLTWIFYVTMAELLCMFAKLPLPTSPVAALEPFRIPNHYGLFAVMTRGRYEIEFQGSTDGQNWVTYPFRYKPHAVNQPRGIYELNEPRVDSELWCG